MQVSQTTTHDFGATNVNTTNWQELTLVNENSSTTQIMKDDINAIEFKNESGSVVEIGVGVSGQSSPPYAINRIALIAAGRFGKLKTALSRGLAIYVRAVDTTADQGMLTLNLLRGRK
jgi:hypothetical protein